jgi:hypothetical protein
MAQICSSDGCWKTINDIDIFEIANRYPGCRSSIKDFAWRKRDLCNGGECCQAVGNDGVGYVFGISNDVQVTDAARKTAVDSCTFEVKAWSLRGFALLKGPAESTMTASAT